VRSRARYTRSLELLRRAKEMAPRTITKSGLMVGLGETKAELIQVMADLVDVRCGVLTVGQYLQPSRKHLPVDRYYRPEEFQKLAEAGRRLGLRHVEAGPLVRSSYRAERQLAGLSQPIVVG
jgi:lipoyl synthase